MRYTKQLWNVTVTTDRESIDVFAEHLSNEALSVSIFAPPRKATASIEAHFDAEPDRASLIAQLAVIAMLHKTKIPKIEIREVPKLDWLVKVAGDFPPLPIARWIIHGAQHRAAVLRSQRALQIDATSAFGTGEHPTTQGCLIMLDWLLKSGLSANRNMKALDLGCGSGILAMAWAQATHGHAVAVDLDLESVEVAKSNVRVNGLQPQVKVGLSKGYNSPLVRRNAPYDLIMSNIFAGPLCQMAKDLKRHLRPGGITILSGILNYQANHVISAHRMQGLNLMRRIVIGEWSILALKRR